MNVMREVLALGVEVMNCDKCGFGSWLKDALFPLTPIHH